MVFDIKDLFSVDSLFMRRYNLTDELVRQIQLFYARFGNFKKVGEDIEIIIPCVLLALHINDYKIDLKSEVRYLVSVYFDESEVIRRQITVYNNFTKFADYYRVW